MAVVPLLLGLFAAGPAAADPIGWHARPGAPVPLESAWRDTEGHPVHLGDLLAGRPVVLAMAYYGCSNFCTLVLDGLSRGLAARPALRVGYDYDVIVASIDPADIPATAAAARRRVGPAAAGWHFLVGDRPAIAALTAATGFGYRYEPDAHQFAHPAGVVWIDRAGRVSGYLAGVEFAPSALEAALRRAERDTVNPVPLPPGGVACFSHDPVLGHAQGPVMALVRAVGAATAIALAGGLLYLARRERRTGPGAPAEEAP